MKSIKVIIAAFVIAIAGCMQANAQFKVGPKVGLNVNSLHFDESILDSDNRAGFTGGIMAEFTVPLVGVGVDVSAMYVRRDAKWVNDQKDAEKLNRDYIAIPVNLKYKLNIPAVNHIVRPFVTTGPEFAFLTSRRAINDALRNKKSDLSWNFGLGVELAKHLQVAASYGLGLNKALETVGTMDKGYDISGKNRYWTVTAAWLF